MIFQFLAETEAAAVAVVNFVKRLSNDKMRTHYQQYIHVDDAETLFRLLYLPPHLLALEDMVFCQVMIQALWAAEQGSKHRASIGLVRSISVEDQDGRCIYWVPSAVGNKSLRF